MGVMKQASRGLSYGKMYVLIQLGPVAGAECIAFELM
jgi:hypothetical protein